MNCFEACLLSRSSLSRCHPVVPFDVLLNSSLCVYWQLQLGLQLLGLLVVKGYFNYQTLSLSISNISLVSIVLAS